MTNNWYKLWVAEEDVMFSVLPTNSTYASNFGAMYWQWANGWISQ